MRYCVNGRQPDSILSEVDEIKVFYKDIGLLYDLLDKFPDKTYILEVGPKDEVNWEEVKILSEKGRVVAAVPSAQLSATATAHGILSFWNYPVTSFYELEGVLNLRPVYVLLGAPLCFDLPKVKDIVGMVPIRLVANIAYDAYLPHKNGVNGQWVRPEDVEYYEPYVSTLEFITQDLGKEANLFKIYQKDKAWPGNLNLLFINFNYNVDNRLLPKDIGERRIRCGQRCMSDGTCHYCFNTIQFATSIRKEHFNNDSNSLTK